MIVFRHNGKEINITREGTENKIDWFRYNTLCFTRRESKW